MNEPKVSVMMPARNTEKYISQAIQSIIDQTYKNWELIIVDDKSKDNTRTIAEEYAKNDSRIKIYEGNGIGVANARNKIISLSTGKYIMLMDSDDTCSSLRIKTLVNIAEKNKKSYVGSNLNFVDSNLLVLNSSDKPTTNKEIRAGFKRLLNRETIVSGTVLANREIFEKYRYNEFYKIMSDWDLTLRISEDKNIVFANAKDVLYNYRLNDNSLTLNQSERIKYNLLLRINEFKKNRNKREIRSFQELEILINKNFLLKLIYIFFTLLKKNQHNRNLKKYNCGS